MNEDYGWQAAGTSQHFHPHQFLPCQVPDVTYISKEGPMLHSQSGILNRESTRKADANAHFLSKGWEGFSFMALENGSVGRALPVDRRLDSIDCHGDVAVEFCSLEQKRKQSRSPNFSSCTQQISPTREEESLDDDAGSLSLKLCSGSFYHRDDVGNDARNTKRFRPTSPGGQPPVCQVDNCHTDLKHAKDYHRRHKVCELHSKAPHALVHSEMQRFCQQCSRFHVLEEFDDGKRSCRRRLAGHNKRRRKSNPDLGTNNISLPGGTDILNIIGILAQLQSTKLKEKLDVPNTVQEPSLQGLKQAGLISSLSTLLGRDVLAAASQIVQALPGQNMPDLGSQAGALGPFSGISQAALTLVLRDVLGAQIAGKLQQAQVSQQVACQNGNKLSSSLPCQSDHAGSQKAFNKSANLFPFGLSWTVPNSSGPSHFPDLNSEHSGPNHILGHTDSSSSEPDLESPPDSSVTRSPAERNFFPTETGGTRHVADRSNQQLSYSSESGSDQSPASSTSRSQDLNGRIIFKLFDPSHLANITHKEQCELKEWLSISPGCMECYIRPGCILLTVFLSMPYSSWKELVVNLRGKLNRLVQLSHGDMWTKGRILVQVGHQKAMIINGKLKKVRGLHARKGPLLLSVRPLAVVAGQEATLTVHGYNLVPHTKIVCVYHGRYILHEVLESSCEDTLDDCSSGSLGEGCCDKQVHMIQFPGGPADVLGRCFIEVENGLLGNILPVIVADEAICSELRSLEMELDLQGSWQSSNNENLLFREKCTDKEIEAINFLHELGWIFQSRWSMSSFFGADVDPSCHISLWRLTGLLAYAVSRDWCAVVRKLLDLLFIMGTKKTDEVMIILSELNLVHQAVKRKCRLMVELLLQFIPEGVGSGGPSIFTPIISGPAGLTPLHVAASIHDAEDIVDALTSDPLEVGLHGWKSALDISGRTPEWHAQNAGNFSYLKLIERKISGKQSSFVCIPCPSVAELSSKLSIEGNGSNRAKCGTLAQEEVLSIELPPFSRTRPSSGQVCRDCRTAARGHPFRSSGVHSKVNRLFMTMMVAVAAVCAMVTLFSKTLPHLDYLPYSLKWEGIMYGPA